MKHTCIKCGLHDFPAYTFAGPHIKEICGGCNFYIKFANKSTLPDIKILKSRIWVKANKNLEIINAAKDRMGTFYEGMDKMEQIVNYSILYHEIHT